MKYTRRKMEAQDSGAAIEIRALLTRQEPKIGNTAIAGLMGVSVETINSIVHRGRIPGVGIINGLARVLKLDDAYVKKLMDLRDKDILKRKIGGQINLCAKGEVESIIAILGVLNEEQVSEIKRIATTFAIANLSPS